MATEESRILTLENKMDDVMRILKGNGRPGLIDQVNDHVRQFTNFFAVYTSREEDKKIYDDRQSRKMTILIALGMLIIALLSFFGFDHFNNKAFLAPHSSLYNASITER
jgi:hypothetical protein